MPPNGPNATEGIDLEAILVEMGSAGKYQLRNYILIVIPIIFGAMYNAQFVFNTAKPNQRCKVPECEKSPPEFEPGEWKSWGIPSSPEKARCYRYGNKDGQCKADSFNKNLKPCDSWLYENNNSIVAEFDLGCHEWKRTLVGSAHCFGYMGALAYIGIMSDRFGRKWTLILASTLPFLVGLARAFSNGYYMYLFLEYLEAIVDSGVYSAGYILAMEMTGLNKRVLTGSCIPVVYSVGQAFQALVAWLLPYWRLQTIIIYVPSAIFLSYYFCLVESVRWLFIKGRKREAAEIIFKAAAVNGKTLSPETISKLTSEFPVAQSTKTFSEAENNCLNKCLKEPKMIFRSRILLSRLFIAAFWFITLSFVYYGLSINSVSLAGDKHVNYAFLSLIEIPGIIMNIFTLDRFGRKKSIVTAYFICAISLTAIPFVTIGWLVKILALVAKMFISMVYTATDVYVLELGPTQVRHTLLSMCQLIGQIGSIAAPLSPMLEQMTPYFLYIVFSILVWCAGLLTFLTPETLGKRLPDTVSEAERLAIDHSSSAGRFSVMKRFGVFGSNPDRDTEVHK